MNTTNILLVEPPITYEWHGGFGATLKSYERGVTVGTVRRIGHFNFYAYMVSKRFMKQSEIAWALAEEDVTAERIREVRRRLFP